MWLLRKRRKLEEAEVQWGGDPPQLPCSGRGVPTSGLWVKQSPELFSLMFQHWSFQQSEWIGSWDKLYWIKVGHWSLGLRWGTPEVSPVKFECLDAEKRVHGLVDLNARSWVGSNWEKQWGSQKKQPQGSSFSAKKSLQGKSVIENIRNHQKSGYRSTGPGFSQILSVFGDTMEVTVMDFTTLDGWKSNVWKMPNSILRME